MYDLSILGNPGSYFILTNSTFNESKITIDQNSNLTVRWYLQVYVEDSLGTPIPAADVRIRDNENGTYDKNFTTDTDGYVRWIVLTEYWQNKSTKIYYTPYNITVSYDNLNFTDNPRESEINRSKAEVFRATSALPEFGNVWVVVIFVMLLVVVGRALSGESERRER